MLRCEAEPKLSPAAVGSAREGAGAAGGLGFGVLAFAGGRLEPGAPWLLDRAGFDRFLGRVDGVITGEGSPGTLPSE